MASGIYAITDHGAVGDGRTNNTATIQATIDTCASSGGGRVFVPPGVYRTGTLYLRNHVELHLAAGATLRASEDRADYNADGDYPENHAYISEHVTSAHLIMAYDVHDIAITGCGTIDGNGAAFFDALPSADLPDTYRAPRRMLTVHDWRPGQMIWLCRCQNVKVCDVTLRDASYWTLFFLGCQDVHVRGLTVTNPPQTPNGDGVGIDCCQNVIVSDCNIRTGDDCITLRANDTLLGQPTPCENIVVTNCILSSPANGVRVGVGDGSIRHCQLNNLVIANSRVGINMTACFPGMFKRGVLMEHITFSNITIDAILGLQALHGTGAQPGSGLRHITFNNFRVKVSAGTYLGANANNHARHISFRDWDIHLQNETIAPDFVDRVRFPDPIEGCTGEDGSRILPAGLYVRYVDGLQARNVRVHRGDALKRTWLKDTWFESCVNVDA